MAKSANRALEITTACRRLYGSYSFHEINLKLISSETSMSRPSIYNYFQTKEEIFLEILREECELWCDDLEALASAPCGSLDAFASALATSLSKRTLMLKIQCMNLYEIEDNSRYERLRDFKLTYARSLELVERALTVNFPSMDGDERKHFVFSFYPFLYGIYPYAFPTEKQSAAMKGAGIDRPNLTIEGMVAAFVKDIIKEV